MATRARFGRLPRSAPSLTSTIVALAEQYQGQRDRNIETAWKQGVEFEGKEVTDERFLAHWKERMKGVSSDDPMWDYYNNLIHNYEFQIAESKMGLKYAQKKVSDGEMAAFYSKWANKLPVHSEAYRSLMTQAAKFKSAAASRGYGRSAANSRDAYYKAQQNTYNDHEAPFDQASQLLAQYAIEAGILDRKDVYKPNGDPKPDYGWSELSNADGVGDPTKLATLLTELSLDPDQNAYITAAIKAAGGGQSDFSGSLNVETLTALANDARNGASIRMQRGMKAGLKSDVKAAKASMNAYSTTATVIGVTLGKSGAASFVQQNDHYRALMDDVVHDPTKTEMDKHVAIQDYQNWLSGEGSSLFLKTLPKGSLDKMNPNYNQTAAGIVGRINGTLDTLNGNPGGKTLKDDLYGFSTNETGESSDAMQLSEIVNDNRFLMDSLASGTAITVRTSGEGKNAKPDPNGDHWTVYDRNAPEVKDNADLVPIAVSAHGTYTSSDGKYTMGGGDGEVRYGVAVPIKVRVHKYQDPQTGAYTGQIDPYEGMDDVVGKQITIDGPGGAPVTLYGVYSNGVLGWTHVNPFVNDPTEKITTDPDGTIVHNFTAAQAPQAGGKVPTGNGPADRFNPHNFVNGNALMSPESKPDWNTATDKQTIWSSPMEALSNTSSEHTRYAIEDLGSGAVKKAQTEWYSKPENWTTKMTNDFNTSIQNGVDPTTAAGQVVEDKSDELVTTLQFNRVYGYTPEQQNATRSAMAAKADAETAARTGVRPGQATEARAQADRNAERDDLVTKLQDWGFGNETTKWSGATIRPGVETPAYGQLRQGKVNSPLPSGWSAKDLLTQPGMNLQAANDLAYRISKGAVGKAFSYGGSTTVVPEGSTGMAGPVPYKVPNTNPFLPKPGQKPKTTYGGAPLQTVNVPAMPKYGPPTPRKAAPKPNETEVNAATGFTVQKVGTAKPLVRRKVTNSKGELVGVREGGRYME